MVALWRISTSLACIIALCLLTLAINTLVHLQHQLVEVNHSQLARLSHSSEVTKSRLLRSYWLTSLVICQLLPASRVYRSSGGTPGIGGMYTISVYMPNKVLQQRSHQLTLFNTCKPHWLYAVIQGRGIQGFSVQGVRLWVFLRLIGVLQFGL